MRKGVLAGALVLFLAWFLWKGLPFLRADRPAIWATPTVQPTDPSLLFPVRVPGGARVCVDGMPWGPQARVVQVTLLPGRRPSPELRVEARAPGYVARGTIAAGLGDNQPGGARITPAPREVTGTLCIRNTGRHTVGFYGVPAGGRTGAPVTVTIDGKKVADRQISVTLLSSPAQSMLSRFGDLIDHAAAWRPLASWTVWLLALALLIGTPIGVAVALARAGALDDERRPPPRDRN
jgi:hypothetical protein